MVEAESGKDPAEGKISRRRNEASMQGEVPAEQRRTRKRKTGPQKNGNEKAEKSPHRENR